MTKMKIKIKGIITEVNVPNSLLEETHSERLNKEKQRQKKLYDL